MEHEKIVEVIHKKIEEQIQNTNAQLDLVNIAQAHLNFNSIEYLTFIVYLEEYFDMEFDDKMLLLNAFTDVDAIANYIIEKKFG